MLTKQQCEAIRQRMTAPDSTPAEAVAAVPDLVETVEELRELLSYSNHVAFIDNRARERIDKALE